MFAVNSDCSVSYVSDLVPGTSLNAFVVLISKSALKNLQTDASGGSPFSNLANQEADQNRQYQTGCTQTAKPCRDTRMSLSAVNKIIDQNGDAQRRA
jgi:hypothetical protein